MHKPYNYKCDVYSYAILLWEALHRQVPFANFAPLQAVRPSDAPTGPPPSPYRVVRVQRYNIRLQWYWQLLGLLGLHAVTSERRCCVGCQSCAIHPNLSRCVQ